MAIDPTVKKLIIQQEMQACENTIYLLELRYRVNKSIGSDQSVLDNLTNDLVKNTQALDVFKKELETVEKEIADVNRKAKEKV